MSGSGSYDCDFEYDSCDSEDWDMYDQSVCTLVTPKAGNIKHYKANWQKLTTDPNILHIVDGYHIEFASPPLQDFEPRQHFFKGGKAEFLATEIHKLLQKGVIVPSLHEEGEFISPVFLRPKKNGSFRVILNLKRLNEYVVYHHFKMDTLETCVNLMTPQCYMASLDLTDAYYAVPIAACCQKYLKFKVGDQLYMYTCLPNGLASGPRVFTKLLKPIYSKLRQENHLSSAYLDDSYLQGTTTTKCAHNVAATKELLLSTGFSVNEEKSVSEPTQVLDHLGFTLNSIQMTVNLGPDKVENIRALASYVLQHPRLTIRLVARLIGTFVSCFPGMEHGPLHYRHLERDKSRALRANAGSYEASIILSEQAKQEILWWLDMAGANPRRTSHGNAELILQTDASKEGWGAKLLQGPSTGGRWSDNEQEDHINVLELRAAQLGLKSLCASLNNTHVQVQMDNVTAVSYIREMGGSHSTMCNSVAFDIWAWCIERDIWLSATFIPGVTNVEADRESRLFDDKTEWRLNPTAFTYCTELWGQPEIDLFASRLNYQFKPYVSWRPDPDAIAIDAFSISWNNKYVYLFPPFSVIPRVLRKLQEDSAKAILIAPQWPTQAWYPMVQNLMIDKPLLLPRSKTLLTLPGQVSRTHPLYPKMRLQAFLLSGRG